MWKATDNLYFYINIHDPKNATHYYRWEFNEGWIFHTDFDSDRVSNGYQIVDRTKFVFFCYGSDTSHEINLGTSAALSQDVINQQLVNTIPSTSEKIGIEYSMQVKQYALTKDAYDYGTLLKKNTENLGSIFDAQPSASIGNIHNINNASEPVLGYISAGTFSASKRVFIHKNQLPGNWVVQNPYPVGLGFICYETSLSGDQLNMFVNFKNQGFLGYSTQLVPTVGGFAAPICVDCTLRGSVNKPYYWQ